MKDENEAKAWAFIWSGVIISYLMIAIFLICWSLTVDNAIYKIVNGS